MKKTSITVFGLGKMGSQIARRLDRSGFSVLGWDPSIEDNDGFQRTGVFISNKLEEVFRKTEKTNRIFWIMIPQANVDEFLENTLMPNLRKGDIVVDGGNSFYKESMRRSGMLEKIGVFFYDCGTSGGIHGEKNGFSLMVGGPKEKWNSIEPFIKALSSGDNYAYLGKSGAGHFTKMVHNGIEYGMMEAIAEGYAVLDASQFKLDLSEVTKTYQSGSVIRSWLIDLCADIFKYDDIKNTKGIIEATGEGEWTINTAKELGVDVRVIEDAFRVREESKNLKNQNKFSNKIVALLRRHFGGHNAYHK